MTLLLQGDLGVSRHYVILCNGGVLGGGHDCGGPVVVLLLLPQPVDVAAGAVTAAAQGGLINSSPHSGMNRWHCLLLLLFLLHQK